MSARDIGLAPAVAGGPAAGASTRMGPSTTKKTYTRVAGQPLITHTVSRLLAAPEIAHVYLVVAPAEAAGVSEAVLEPHGLADDVTVVAGGASRQESVMRGLVACQDAARFVVVHDGARPLVTLDMVARTLAAARQVGAATVGIPVKDTLKRGDGEHLVTASVDREMLWRVQTPQAFRLDLLLDAHVTARSQGIHVTDDYWGSYWTATCTDGQNTCKVCYESTD